MFDHFVWSVAVCPVAVAVAIRFLADRLRPDAALLFFVASMAATALACMINLTMFALKALAELPMVAALLGVSDEFVRADTAYVPWVSWLSLTMLLTTFAGMAWTWRAYRRDLAFARRFADLPTEDGQLTILDDPRPEAFAVPTGGAGRIVVTAGMREALDDTQFAALLAHERAHLTQRHHRLVQVVRLSAAVHPVFWWLARRMDYLVERAADEHAATTLGNRAAVARAIAAAALVGVHPRRAVGLRMVPTDRDMRQAGAVPRRVASLIAPRSRRSALLVVAPAAVAVSSMFWTGECVYDLGELLHAARLERR
ncbi:M56 family metallopeptidase [Dactylosporangium sp. NPDC005555]|uniref:M56 family metallopeptidase n=1 Tax=Dactylosporangium sp. NPDC005555 TaxID=3154889 RepID=UPI0033AC7FD9